MTQTCKAQSACNYHCHHRELEASEEKQQNTSARVNRMKRNSVLCFFLFLKVFSNLNVSMILSISIVIICGVYICLCLHTLSMLLRTT